MQSDETHSTRQALLERFPVFAKVPASLLEQVLATTPPRSVRAGSLLFDRNMPCEGFPLLLEGSVRVSSSSGAGREIVLYRVTPGEGCILSGGCLLGQSDYTARGVAETDVIVMKIAPALFNELMLHADAFRRFVFDMYGTRLAEVMEVVEEVAFRKLDTRLARLLLQRGPLVAATHQAIADDLGSVRVFVSRLLRSFEERGWVRLERERVEVVDPRGLAAFSRE
ncbi:MAG: Crp/Fnr family transcriptional regulator [Ideonella sp.]|nr:Crp/Fnr family transcriptional regulator [Ideonella sp.]MCC7459509.1 Crp/Fnr family transcriptional regulator [Nitrospira sp.]